MTRLRAPLKRLRLPLVLYPFVTAAIAINVFMLGLGLNYMHLPSASPVTALLLALPLGIPGTWLTARWVARLIAEAERR